MKNNNVKYNKAYYTESAKRERFIRLASSRTEKLLKDIRLLENLSNKNLYIYEDFDIERIFGKIETRLLIAKSNFKLKNEKRDKFRL